MAKKIDPKPFFVIGILVVLVAGGYFILGGGDEFPEYYDFASCLAEENATMYGFDACPHCNRQKTLIGREAFEQEIDQAGFYVRCQPEELAEQELGERANYVSSVQPLSPDMTQREACIINVGAGTPTWVIDGEKHVGEQSLADLAEATGCPLPEGYRERRTRGFTPSNSS